MKTTTIKLPEALDARLSSLARKQGRSKSHIMRQAFEAFIEKQEKSARPSCHDLGKHLAGCLKGPEDLSTNPVHMEDYGK